MSTVVAADHPSKIYTFDSLTSKLLASQDRQLTFCDSAIQEEIKAAINALPCENRVISLDIFDTLLLRSNESEYQRFYTIAKEQADYLNKKYATNFSQNDLLAARLSGTKISYKASKVVEGTREGSFDDIYRVAAHSLNLDATVANELIELELKHEIGALEVNRGLLSIIKEEHNKGATCLLISDMYLHAKHIEVILDTLIPDWRSIFDHLFSSADSTVSKASTKLFVKLAKDHGFEYGNWIHMGDAIKGDYKCPITLGISAIHLPLPNECREKREACESDTRSMLATLGLDPHQFNA